MAEIKEFQNLEDFAAFLGYDFPEEIHIVAACEGFYEMDDQGDPFLSINGINDYLSRLNADVRVVGLASGIQCEMKERATA